MQMRFKLHQEETLPEHQKKFSHKKNYGMPDQLHDVFKSTRLKIWHTVVYTILFEACNKLISLQVQ